MKKIVAAVASVLLIVSNGHGQYAHPFGSLSPEELALKSCSFDPGADAVVLLDEGLVDHDDDYRMVTYVHRKIKILKEGGIDNADIKIFFQSKDGYEFIDDLQAMTVNVDENGEKKYYVVDPQTIYTKQTDAYFSSTSFAFPQVKVGSILDYKYRSVKSSFGGLREWRFQSRLPVYKSALEVRPASIVQYTYELQKSPDYAAIIKPSKSEGSVYFEMDSIPALTDEPYMDAREDYLQKVKFTVTAYKGMAGTERYMDNWNTMASRLWDDPYFGQELRVNVREAQDEIAAATAGRDDFGKMCLIYNYVRKNIEWNGVHSIYAIDGVKSTWKKKAGTSGSVNLLMINLMRGAGLEVYPLLVSERNHGRINVSTPFLNEFNTVYAAVKINNKNYYLNAADEGTSPQLIPYSLLNTTALIVKNKSGELVEINETERKFREIVYLSADISAEGKLTSDVQIISKDYAQQDRKLSYDSKNKEKYIENVLLKNITNASVDSLTVSGGEDSADLIRKFSMSSQLQSTNNYRFLDLNIFSGFEKNPFLSKNRFSNVNFGYMRNVNLVWLIKIPQGWMVDALPKNIKLVNNDRSVSFSRELVYNKDLSQISARIKIDLSKSTYNPAEYPALNAFFASMVNMLNEQIVFKTN